MKNKQINGRRAVFAMAAAELELRKQEGIAYAHDPRITAQGFALFDGNAQMWQHRKNQKLTRHWESFKLADVWNVAQIITNYNQALDYAMCFVLRYKASSVLFAAHYVMTDKLGGRVRERKYRESMRQRLAEEFPERDETDEELEAWQAGEIKRAASSTSKMAEKRAYAAALERGKKFITTPDGRKIEDTES